MQIKEGKREERSAKTSGRSGSASSIAPGQREGSSSPPIQNQVLLRCSRYASGNSRDNLDKQEA